VVEENNLNVQIVTAGGAHADAIAAARRAVKGSRGEGHHFRLLEPLAINAAQAGRAEDAAWICGFVDAIHGSPGEVRWPDAAARRNRLDTLLAEVLDLPTVTRRGATGRTPTVEESFRARAWRFLSEPRWSVASRMASGLPQNRKRLAGAYLLAFTFTGGP